MAVRQCVAALSQQRAWDSHACWTRSMASLVEDREHAGTWQMPPGIRAGCENAHIGSRGYGAAAVSFEGRCTIWLQVVGVLQSALRTTAQAS